MKKKTWLVGIIGILLGVVVTWSFMEGYFKKSDDVTPCLTVIPKNSSLTSQPTPASSPKSVMATSTEAGSKDLEDLLGSATTSFTGSSADRINNITLGAMRIDGTVVMPGEEFSILKAIGSISEDSGFKSEYVIQGDKSVKALGGGLCQVSTTLFRSILSAGFPITERQGHSYVVSYYGPGLDATVFLPRPDLKFVNDTANPITITGRVVDHEISFSIFGVSDGRIATTTSPKIYNRKPALPVRYIIDDNLGPGETKCVDRSREGLTTEVVYQVAYPSGEIKKNIFKTVYQAWAGLCYVGP